jgi:hypothetical protein
MIRPDGRGPAALRIIHPTRRCGRGASSIQHPRCHQHDDVASPPSTVIPLFPPTLAAFFYSDSDTARGSTEGDARHDACMFVFPGVRDSARDVLEECAFRGARACTHPRGVHPIGRRDRGTLAPSGLAMACFLSNILSA